MRLRSLRSQLDQLRSLIDQTASLPDDSIELRSHWARYICIRTAGFFENALSEVCAAYARTSASERVANYVEASLSRVQNPNAERFLQVTRSFDKSLAAELEEFLLLEGRKDAIDSIMSNRHLIAHGSYSGITVVRVRDYLERGVRVIEFLEDRLDVPRS